MRVVSELGEHPAGEDHPESGLAQIDLTVRVLPKMGINLGLERRDFGIECADDRDQGALVSTGRSAMPAF